MKSRKKYLTAVITGVLTMTFFGGYVYAPNKHFTDSTKEKDWDSWVLQWENKVSTDYEKIALTPGADETKMNFAWYSLLEGEGTPIVLLSTHSDMGEAISYEGTTSPAIDGYRSNKVSVSSLKENTKYYYQYFKNGVPEPVESFQNTAFYCPAGAFSLHFCV